MLARRMATLHALQATLVSCVAIAGAEQTTRSENTSPIKTHFQPNLMMNLLRMRKRTEATPLSHAHSRQCSSSLVPRPNPRVSWVGVWARD